MGQVFDVKLHQKSMRTSRIDRCEPRYAGTEFTNRENSSARSEIPWPYTCIISNRNPTQPRKSGCDSESSHSQNSHGGSQVSRPYSVLSPFSKGYANIAKPLQNLTKNDVSFEWTPACQQAFDTLIDNLTSAPLLAYPDCEKPFLLSCDASDVAIGYILSQLDNDKREHVIEYSGRALRRAELNYSVTDKEALAVVEGFRHFHTYLYGNHTTVITDHIALEHIHKNPKITGRVARWNILLQNYDYTVQYKKGKLNTNADAVSRLDNLPSPPNDNPDDILPEHVDLFPIHPDPTDIINRDCEFRAYHLFDIMEPVMPSVMPINDIDIVTAQQQCPEIGPIYAFIHSGDLPKDTDLKPSIIADAAQYFVKDGMLNHLYQPRVRNLQKHKPLTSQIVIPKSVRPLILSEFHDSLLTGGHQGFLRTYAAIRERYYWPQMYREILDYQRTCYPCQRASNHRPRPPPLGKFPPFPEPSIWSRVHLDFLGPLRESHNKDKYILLVMDAFSKWPEAFALPSCDAITVAQVLYKEIFTRYGSPNVIITDRGQCFVSHLVKALCALFGVKETWPPRIILRQIRLVRGLTAKLTVLSAHMSRTTKLIGLAFFLVS